MTNLSKICFDVDPHVARQVKRQPDDLGRLALLTSYFAQQAAGEQLRQVGVPDEYIRVVEAGSVGDSVVESLPMTRAGDPSPALDPPAEPRAVGAIGGEVEDRHILGHPSTWGRGEPPTAFDEAIQAPRAGRNPVDWYSPLPDSAATGLATRLITVPEEVEQPVAARLELTRLLSLVLAHPDAVTRVESVLADADGATRGTAGIHIVPRNTPLPEYMRAIGADTTVHTHDGRPAGALRSVADLHSHIVFVAEENILGEQTTYENAPAPHPDGYSSVVHELAHFLYAFGLDDDQRSLVAGVHSERVGAGNEIPWVDGPRLDLDGEPTDNYASQNPEEFFAQLTNAYFGANTGSDPLTGQARNNGVAWIEANEPQLYSLLHRQYGDPAPLNPYNPVVQTSAQNDVWQGLHEFTDLTESTEAGQAATGTTEQAAVVHSGVTTAPEDRSVIRTERTGERVEHDSWLGSVEGELVPRAASPEQALDARLPSKAPSGSKPSLTLDVSAPSLLSARLIQSPESLFQTLVSPIDSARSPFGLVRTPEGPLRSPARLIRTPLTARPAEHSAPWFFSDGDVPEEVAEEEGSRPLDGITLTPATVIQQLLAWIENDVEVGGRGRLGADLFGLHIHAPTPGFLVSPETGKPYDYSSIDADQGVYFLHLMDMHNDVGAQFMDPRAWDGISGQFSLGHERDTLQWAENADAPLLPDLQVRTPLVVHAVWLGGPLRESGPSAGFWIRFGSAAQRLNGQAFFVLWTDVPRVQIQEVRDLQAAPADPVLAEVWGMVQWAKINGVKLVDPYEVFNDSAPMELHDQFMVEVSKAVGTGWAAASDILRLEILDRFGGLYTDGDNDIKDLSSFDQVTRSREGYAIAADRSIFSNAALAVTRFHPFPRMAKSVIAANYAKTQVELIGPGGANASNDFWTRNPGRSKRHSVIIRTGPDAFVGMLGQLGLRRATHMPHLQGIGIRSDFSWSAEEQAKKYAGVPAFVYTAEDTMRLVAGVVQTMVRSLLNRHGDLHLTQIEPVVRRHQDPGLVWESAFGVLASKENLRSLVRGVTRTTYLSSTASHHVELPQAVEALLLPPAQPESAPIGNAEGWWLGERSTPVRLAALPTGADSPALAGEDTRSAHPPQLRSSELFDDLAGRVRNELERLGRTDLSIGVENVAEYFEKTQESANDGPRGHMAGRIAGWFANNGEHVRLLGGAPSSSAKSSVGAGREPVGEPSEAPRKGKARATAAEGSGSALSAGPAVRASDATDAQSVWPPAHELVAFLDAPRTRTGSERADEVVQPVSESAITAAQATVRPLPVNQSPLHHGESVEVPAAAEAHHPEVSSTPRSVDDLFGQFSKDVRPALRVWERTVADEIQALKGILGSPGARALVFGLDGDGPVWAVNMAGTLTWLTNALLPLSPPETVDGPVVSIDIDSHGQLTGPAEQKMRETGITLSDGVKTGFCDLNFGTDIRSVTGWRG